MEAHVVFVTVPNNPKKLEIFSHLKGPFKVISKKSELIDELKTKRVDALVIDDEFGRFGGLSYFKDLKKNHPTVSEVPVFFFSKDSDSTTRAKYYREGCDGFIDGRFSNEETTSILINGISAHSKKLNSDMVLSFGDIVLDMENLKLITGSRAFSLSVTEYKLLLLLIKMAKIKSREPITKDLVSQKIWGCEPKDLKKSNLSSYIGSLRKMLKDTNIDLISKRGRGVYLMVKENRYKSLVMA